MEHDEMAEVKRQMIGKVVADVTLEDKLDHSVLTIRFSDKTQVVFASGDPSNYSSWIAPSE